MNVLDTLRRVLIANELGGHSGLAYRFSDPDGREGRSGYSFGVCQFDLAHNPARAAGILSECGFSETEIGALKQQCVSAEALAAHNRRLVEQAAVIDRADAEEIAQIIVHVRQVVANRGLQLADNETFIHLCDYHNQFHLDFDGKFVRHFLHMNEPVDAVHMLTYKLGTAWGAKRPDDVKRRWNNVVRICREIMHARVDEIRANHTNRGGNHG